MSTSVFYYSSYTDLTEDKSVAFSAASLDISEREAEDIISLTEYKPSRDLPLSPTPDDVKRLFPRKYSFFGLVSGRICFACSTFVGRDKNGRGGMYFVHAIVTDSIEGICPADLIESDCFVSEVPASDILKISRGEDIKGPDLHEAVKPLTSAELSAFFKGERAITLKKLAACFEKKENYRIGINLCDAQNTYKYWISALYRILPGFCTRGITFSTYGGSRAFSISCAVTENVYINAINIKSHTFDVKNGAVDVSVGASLCLSHACSLFAGSPDDSGEFVNDINKISRETDTEDFDELFKIFCVQNNRYDVFTSATEMKKTLARIFEATPDCAQRITKNTVFALGFSVSLYKNYEYGDLLRFLFIYADLDDRAEILFCYLDTHFERSFGNEPFKFYQSVKKDCICPWEDAVAILFTPKLLDRIAAYNTPCSKFLICALMIDAYPTLTEPRSTNAVEYLADACCVHVANNEIESAALILRIASHGGGGLDLLINQKICTCDLPALSDDPDRTFEYIEKTETYGELFWTLIINCAKSTPDSVDTLISGFLRFCKVYPDKKEPLTKIGEKREISRVFLKAVALYEFEHRDSFDMDVLTEKYEPFMFEENKVIAEKAQRIYLETLANYLSGLEPKARISACVKFVKRIFAKNLPTRSDRRILSLINNAMFSKIPLELVEKSTTGDFVENFAQFLINADVEVLPVTRAIIEGNTFDLASRGKGAGDASMKKIADAAASGSFTFVKGELSPEDLDGFGNIYLISMFECAKRFARIDDKLFASYMDEIMSYMLVYKDFVWAFEYYLDEDADRALEFLGYMFDYAFQSAESPMTSTVKAVAVRYLERRSGSRRKKILISLCENVKTRSKMEKFAKEFMLEHTSFGSKKIVFGKKSKKRSKR